MIGFERPQDLYARVGARYDRQRGGTADLPSKELTFARTGKEITAEKLSSVGS